MIILIVGNVGSGKTLMLTIIGTTELDAGKQVYSTYHLNYGSKGNKPFFVDVGDLFAWFQQQDKEFKPDTGTLLLDEGYLGIDSRMSGSAANRLLSHFAFQSRKLGLDLYVSAQLASSIDKRIRNLADAIILAEKYQVAMEDGTYQWEFKYTYANADGGSGELVLNEHQVQLFYPYYSTMEIVEPPMISLDKKAMKAAKEERARISIERKGKQKIDFKVQTSNLSQSQGKRVSKKSRKNSFK